MFKGILMVLFSILLLPSCQNGSQPITNEGDRKSVKEGVLKMTTDIASDIEKKGPIAWLDYFEQSPSFFMANDGQCVFPNNDSATKFVRDVVAKNILDVKLKWSNMRIDSLSPTMAILSADFHEDLFGKTNQMTTQDGYFTGLAEETSTGWKLRNLHWSTLKK
jgi:hypothetical protein